MDSVSPQDSQPAPSAAHGTPSASTFPKHSAGFARHAAHEAQQRRLRGVCDRSGDWAGLYCPRAGPIVGEDERTSDMNMHGGRL
jgi:hypothetical protein